MESQIVLYGGRLQAKKSKLLSLKRRTSSLYKKLQVESLGCRGNSIKRRLLGASI